METGGGVTAPGGHPGSGPRPARPGDSPAAGSAPDRAAGAGVPPAGATRRGLLASPAVQGFAALVVYLAVWVIADALPLVLHPGQPQLNQASMDPNLFTWSLRWWPYAIAHGLNPLYTAQAGAPAGYDLAWVTTVPTLALPAAPLTLAAGPVVSFNLLAAASVPVSGWVAFVLCRRLTHRFWPALAGGAVYGFSAYEMNHIVAGQLNLAISLLLPLMAYLVVAWRDGDLSNRVFTALLALTMVAQFYLFLETFADMTVVWVLALATGYVLASRADRPVVARLSRLVAMAYAVTIVFAAPYLLYALAHRPPGYRTSPASSSLDLAGLIIPRPSQTFGISWLARPAAQMATPALDGYVGIPLLVLVVALAVFMWSRRITRFLVVMLALLVLGALGPVVHVAGHRVIHVPWAGLWMLPVADSAYPARLMGFAFLALAVMVAIWLAGPRPRPWLRWLLAVAAVAGVAVNVPALNFLPGPGLPAFIATGEYSRVLHPGGTVVVISEQGNAGLLWQAETGFYFRLAGGYVNVHTARRTDLPAPVVALARTGMTPANVRQFRLFLARARVGAILVQPGPGQVWPGMLARLGLRGHAVGGVLVYRLAS